MVSTNDFKRGMTIKIDGELYSVFEFQHVKPGKGGAFVRTKLKSVKKGTVIDKTFRAGEKVEDVRVEKREMQYLYDEGDNLVFMDNETYEQTSLPKSQAGNLLDYIKEGENVDISLHEEEPLSIEPPIFVQLEVVYAEPGVKGDTATNVQKPVKVETGAELMVPIFVEQGDVIKIDTRTREYVERVKK
jgi:elongation factor P